MSTNTHTCSGCKKSWTGLSPQHCSGCHETFSGTGTGDAHRVGRHGVKTGSDRRRCLSIEEMEAKGLVLNERGIWAPKYEEDPEVGESLQGAQILAQDPPEGIGEEAA